MEMRSIDLDTYKGKDAEEIIALMEKVFNILKADVQDKDFIKDYFKILRLLKRQYRFRGEIKIDLISYLIISEAFSLVNKKKLKELEELKS